MDAPLTNTKRLHIGNLDSTIDEYTLLKLFKPFGKITAFEFLFHMTGPKKGEPRGYCFLEYDENENALKAIRAMHNRRIKGKSLIVTLANMTAEEHEESLRERDQVTGSHHRPSAATILRTNRMANASTDAKIQAIERKLASLQKQPPCAESSSKSTTPPASKQERKGSSSQSQSSERRFKPY